jgi:hypothetical protein
MRSWIPIVSTCHLGPLHGPRSLSSFAVPSRPNQPQRSAFSYDYDYHITLRTRETVVAVLPQRYVCGSHASRQSKCAASRHS